ncbi:hypothetical protein LOAG_01154 [Loa loa]|uniref:BPTI/Kunitz inhibitor domain-containing protein n=1 Tax=Loa loa TaxID=7209 RepID=A0A1S0UAC2_LOALO|nr:hypothetical protein LOAG_01154 [Loa loa]EFO27325.2 hypothetical protein LOAG_01154 [Loa loa]
MDTTYALLLLVFFPASNKAAISTGGAIAKLVVTLSNSNNHPCQQPLQRGNCSQRIPSFYYSNRDHKCRKFMYSGCNGNENRFVNRRQCQAKCGRKRKFRVKQDFSSASSIQILQIAVSGYILAICHQRFDPQYRKLCRQTTSSAPAWELRYFYDIDENRCRRFWYGGCKGSGRNRNIFANEQACELLCVRKNDRISKAKAKNSTSKKTANSCFLKFDTNLRYGCKTFDWRPRFFYNQTSSTCEMFWYDTSCPKRRKVTNMFYHRGICKRLCEQSDQMTGKPSQRNDIRHIGQISAMFSQPYSSMRSKSIQMRKIFDGLLIDAYIKPVKAAKLEISNINCSYTSLHANSTPSSNHSGIHVIPAGNSFGIRATPGSNPSGIHVTHSYVKEAPENDNASSFDFHILKAEFRRSLQKVFPRSAKEEEDNDKTYHFDQFMPVLSKTSKYSEFDPKLADKCNITNWLPRYYYDIKSNKCRMFWNSECTSDNGNNFENITNCQKRCAIRWPGSGSDKVKGQMLPLALITRCLEPLALGNCSKMHPAYYYNRGTQRCEPFVYSGCDGNSNRFLTLNQCQTTCHQFRRLSLLETNCFLPFDGGKQFKERKCAKTPETPGIFYYYSHENECCGRFWYSGCAGNENRFYDLSTCKTVCLHIPTRFVFENVPHTKVYFEPIMKGKCLGSNQKSVQRWAYDHIQLRCVTFNYTGCNGNQNRFLTEYSCNVLCKGLKRPLQERCIAYPNWSNCNQLSNQWFYNLTKGTCEQFLCGDCNGDNGNRFDTIERCQQICGVRTKTECSEPLDRGYWCELMSNRYYYNSEINACKSFHYTECGKSRNIFKTQQECEEKCLNQADLSSPQFPLSNSSSGQINYRSVKPLVKHISHAHQIMVTDNTPYIKTGAQWLEDGKCIGYRYNITGERTRLMSYLCSMEPGGTCYTQILSTTNGDEKCRFVQPWLKGMHLYSWFFTIDRQSYPIGEQALNETVATLIILPSNDCHSIC